VSHIVSIGPLARSSHDLDIFGLTILTIMNVFVSSVEHVSVTAGVLVLTATMLTCFITLLIQV